MTQYNADNKYRLTNITLAIQNIKFLCKYFNQPNRILAEWLKFYTFQNYQRVLHKSLKKLYNKKYI